MSKNLFLSLSFLFVAISSIFAAPAINLENPPVAVTTNQTISLTATLKDFANGNPGQNFYVQYVTGSTVTFAVTGGTPASTTQTVTGTPWAISQTGITVTGTNFKVDITYTIPGAGGGTYTYTYQPIVLPIELSRFQGEKSENGVALNWATESESNNAKFLVERSFNGRDFAAIGEVKGAGTTNIAQNYSFDDKTATNNSFSTVYYRLKNVDFDGKSENSKVITVKTRNLNDNVFTNIAPSASLMSFQLAERGDVEIAIVNLNGQVLASKTVQGDKGLNQIGFDFNNMTSGIYIATMKVAGGTVSKKFVF